jgi:cytochrome c2
VKLIQATILIATAALFAVTLSLGKAEYGKKEAKACTYCHPAGKFKELTDAGKYYKDHNHSLEGYKAPETK